MVCFAGSTARRFHGRSAAGKARIAFIGDSITQGCGTTYNGYKQYAAVAAGRLGEDYAFWDLGLGYARGSDAATDGIWLYKAKQNDLVSVCFGVNDILQGHSAGEVKKECKSNKCIYRRNYRNGCCNI